MDGYISIDDRYQPQNGAKAVLLLKVILRFFEAVSALPGGEGAQARSKAPLGNGGLFLGFHGIHR